MPSGLISLTFTDSGRDVDRKEAAGSEELVLIFGAADVKGAGSASDLKLFWMPRAGSRREPGGSAAILHANNV